MNAERLSRNFSARCANARMLNQPTVTRGDAVSADDLEITLLHLEEVDSTNTYVKNHCQSLSDGTLVYADIQTAGRGRLDRPFVSPTGCGLYASVVLRPKVTSERLPLLTVAAAVAVAEGAEAVSGIPLGIKWVNDVYSHEGKVAGILVETAFSP